MQIKYKDLFAKLEKSTEKLYSKYAVNFGVTDLNDPSEGTASFIEDLKGVLPKTTVENGYTCSINQNQFEKIKQSLANGVKIDHIKIQYKHSHYEVKSEKLIKDLVRSEDYEKLTVKKDFIAAIAEFNAAVEEILALDERKEKTTLDNIKAQVSSFAEMVKESIIKPAAQMADKKATESVPFWSTVKGFFGKLSGTEETKVDSKDDFEIPVAKADSSTTAVAVVSDEAGKQVGAPTTVFKNTLGSAETREKTHEKYQDATFKILSFLKAECFKAAFNLYAEAQACHANKSSLSGSDAAKNLGCDAKLEHMIENAPEIQVTLHKDGTFAFEYQGHSFWDVMATPGLGLPSPEDVLSKGFQVEGNQAPEAAPQIAAPVSSQTLVELPAPHDGL